MVRFGYNWDAGSVNPDFAYKAMRDSGGDAHLLMIANGGFFFTQGDIDLIRKTVQSIPNATIIVRNWNRLEGQWQSYPNALEYEKHWLWVKGQLGADIMRRVVFDDSVNEPNLGGDNVASAQAYVTRCIAMVEAAARAGVKLAIGAWSVGTPHESLLGTVYLPLWKALAKHKQAISMHLYGAIPFEAGETMPIDIALDPAKAREAMRDTKWPITHGGWLIARAYRIIEIFRANGLGIPEIYATEGIVDNIYNSSNSHIKEQWRSKWGIDKFQRDPRGIQTYQRFIEAMYPELDFQHAVAKLFSHARRNIFWHEAFRGVCLFALNRQWGYPSGTNKEAGSNYEDAQFTLFREKLLPELNNAPVDSTPVPPPNPEPPKEATMLEKRIRSTANATNVRNAPNGAILGVLGSAWQDCLVSDDYESATWVKVEVGNLKGYVSRQWVEIDNRVIAPMYNLNIDFSIDKATAERLLAELQKVLKP